MKEQILSAPLEYKAFYAATAGAAMQVFGYFAAMEPVQLMGFIVALASAAVQISLFLRNRAETKRAEEEMRLKAEAAKREQEMHEAKMHFMRRDLTRLAADLRGPSDE